MKHPSNRELFAYWNQQRGRRAAPERGDIDPAAIRHLLADMFILAFAPPCGHPFRVAGTRVCALFGRDLKGASFLDLWAASGRDEMRDLVAVAACELLGVVASISGTTAGDKGHDLELLMLPLGQRGCGTRRVVGALLPREVPEWLGSSALGELTLGTLRYLRADGSALSAPGARARARGRMTRGLVVYDGGRVDAGQGRIWLTRR